MKTRYFIALGVLAALGLLALQYFNGGGKAFAVNNAPDAPEFTHTSEQEWLNSKPLSMQKDLRGKVVLIDFWAFGCWNCYRSFPWMNAMEDRLHGEDFIVIGVHTPEFEHEKIHSSIAEKIDEFMLKHPVMVDNDFSYWRAMSNRYWPTFYLIDKQGKIRAQFIGETHEGDSQAKKIEKTIRELLEEPA